MVRKGELNKGMIDRGWPHQVSLIAEATHGDNYVRVRLFCEPLSLCTRGLSTPERYCIGWPEQKYIS